MDFDRSTRGMRATSHKPDLAMINFSGKVPILLLCIVSALHSATWAAPTAKQRRQAASVRTAIRKAGNLFNQQKYRESVEVVKQVQEEVDRLAADSNQDMQLLLRPVYASLEKAHALLELEGFRLPPLNKPSAATPRPDPRQPPAPSDGDVSFVQHAVPILIGKCGRCHIDDDKGELSMMSYASLMRGAATAGRVIVPQDAAGSRLVEIIESGDMPRGGLRITPAELATLKRWIDQGARFDGDSPQTPLARLAPGVVPSRPEPVRVMPSTGRETVSFASDLAPVLASKCTNCHGTNRPRNQFSVNTIQRLMRGGDSGPPVLPGRPAESLLVQKLKGTAEGQRMPANQPPLSDETIAAFEKWIAEGATFDGPDANQPVAQVAALAAAAAASHEELSAQRQEQANRNWQLGLPGVTFAMVETENFLLLGTVGEASLARAGQLAESSYTKIKTLFKAPPEGRLIKGRMTFYVFQQRYDYSEFGKMVEQRDIPRTSRGHWNYSIVDAYGAIVLPQTDSYSLDAVIGHHLAGAYIASLGSVPSWFSEGSARVMSGALDSSDPRVAEWDGRLRDVLASMNQPDDFLKGRLPPDETDIASYGFVNYLSKNKRQYDQLLDALRGGQEFDASFAAIYGGPPERGVSDFVRKSLQR